MADEPSTSFNTSWGGGGKFSALSSVFHRRSSAYPCAASAPLRRCAVAMDDDGCAAADMATSKVELPRASVAQPGPDEANCLSRGLALWVTRYVLRGLRKPLQPDDMPVVPRSVKAEPMLFASAEQHWAVELKRAKQKGSAPDLIRGVWLPSSPAALWMTIVLSVVSGLCNTVARPLLLRWTLLAIQGPDEFSMEAGMGFAAGLVVVLWIESWTRNYAVMEGSAIAAARMMAGTMHLVGLKALRVATGEGKASAEASIIGNDLVRTSQVMTIVPIMISGLASLAGGIAFLVFVDVGPIALAGLFVMVC